MLTAHQTLTWRRQHISTSYNFLLFIFLHWVCHSSPNEGGPMVVYFALFTGYATVVPTKVFESMRREQLVMISWSKLVYYSKLHQKQKAIHFFEKNQTWTRIDEFGRRYWCIGIAANAYLWLWFTYRWSTKRDQGVQYQYQYQYHNTNTWREENLKISVFTVRASLTLAIPFSFSLTK